MNRILLLVMLFCGISYIAKSQEQEIERAYIAFTQGDLQSCPKYLEQVKRAIAGKSYLVEPDIYAKYLYVLSSLLLHQGKVEESVKVGKILKAYEKGPIYTLKNKTGKQKIYFINAVSANKMKGNNYMMIKNTFIKSDLYSNLALAFNKNREIILEEANKAYEDYNNSVAATKYLEYYNFSVGMNSDEKIYKYYAAVCFHKAGDKDKALDLYIELLYQNFNDKKVGKDLYRLVISILIEQKRYEEVEVFVRRSLKRWPNDQELSKLLGDVSEFLKDPNTEEQLLKKIEKNPNDYHSWLRLGLIYRNAESKTEGSSVKAKEAFKKAIIIKPNFMDAYLCLVDLILESDPKLVEKIKKGSDVNGNTAKRRQIFTEALPFLEKAHKLDEDNLLVSQVLKEAYRVLRMNKKILSKNSKSL